MTGTQVKVPAARRGSQILLRAASFLLLAAIIGVVLNRLSATLDKNARPAGFTRGVVQGALMPMSFPNLLVGRDVTIYSQNNTGLSYNLGIRPASMAAVPCSLACCFGGGAASAPPPTARIAPGKALRHHLSVRAKTSSCLQA